MGVQAVLDVVPGGRPRFKQRREGGAKTTVSPRTSRTSPYPQKSGSVRGSAKQAANQRISPKRRCSAKKYPVCGLSDHDCRQYETRQDWVNENGVANRCQKHAAERRKREDCRAAGSSGIEPDKTRGCPDGGQWNINCEQGRTRTATAAGSARVSTPRTRAPSRRTPGQRAAMRVVQEMGV